MRVAGSLWSVPVEERPARLAGAAAAGLHAAHWDTTDGDFAAAGGFTPQTAAALQDGCPGLGAEAHLMLRDPRPAIPAWAEVCSLVVVHFEADDAHDAVRSIARRGSQPGLAVSLQTPLDAVPSDYPILLMSIIPGLAGTPFDAVVLDRVAALRERDRNQLIGVDGGVGRSQFAALARAGANWVVSGTDLFNAPDPGEWIAACQDAFGADPAGPGGDHTSHNRATGVRSGRPAVTQEAEE